MKTRVVLKSDHLHKADIDAVRLMKTRVVLKCNLLSSSDQLPWFNENKSCIEMCIQFHSPISLQCLMKTRVVLKLSVNKPPKVLFYI